MRILRIAVAIFLTHLLFPVFSVLGFCLCGCDFGTSLGYSYTVSLVLILLGVAIFALFVMLGDLLIGLWTWATQ